MLDCPMDLNKICLCGTIMIFERAGRTNYKTTLHCPNCDHYSEGPCDCELCNPATQAFIRLLQGGITAEGNSVEELGEISETLAKTVTDEIINN